MVTVTGNFFHFLIAGTEVVKVVATNVLGKAMSGILGRSFKVMEYLAAHPDGQPMELAPQAQLTVNDPEALIDLALAGAGIVQGGLQHALPHLRAGTLKLVLPGLHDPGQREVVVHYPHRRYLAPRVRVVVDALLAHFSASADLQLSVQALVRAQPDWVA